MSDKLKKYIEENRDDLDADIPHPRVLKKLKDQLYPETGSYKKTQSIRILPWAVVLGACIVLAGILYITLRKDETKPITVRPEESIPTSDISDPVYARQIVHFKEMIDLQQVQLKQVEKEQPELYRRFEKDINQLDSAYSVLKKMLDNNPNTELVLEAMIQNLRLQTDLLNRQLLIIKEIKQKKDSHEKIDI